MVTALIGNKTINCYDGCYDRETLKKWAKKKLYCVLSVIRLMNINKESFNIESIVHENIVLALREDNKRRIKIAFDKERCV